MLTIAKKGGYMVKKCQKPVYVICEGSLSWQLINGPNDFDFFNRPGGRLFN